MDRKKVIEGLEVCINRVPGKYDCNKCPYEIDGNYCEINLAKDALALLKEQDKIIQNILLEKTNELNDKVTTLQIEAQTSEMRRLLEQK